LSTGVLNGAARTELHLLAERGELVAYFGYGSLVNRATLRTRIIDAVPGRVAGWRRGWQPRPDMTLDPETAIHASLLTVRRDPSCEIDGLVVFDHIDNLPAVDLRENDYHRRLVAPDALRRGGDAMPSNCPLYIYEADPPEDGHDSYPILHSYLDAVLQGFHREHGEAGVREFVLHTENFDTPVLKDRDWPIYPRAVSLDPAEGRLFDRLLAERGVRYVTR
jgi:hypothetical protein